MADDWLSAWDQVYFESAAVSLDQLLLFVIRLALPLSLDESDRQPITIIFAHCQQP